MAITHQHAASHNAMQQLIARYDSSLTPLLPEWDINPIYSEIDLLTLNKPLMIMQDMFYASLSSFSNSGSSGIHEDIIRWLTKEFNNLLAVSHQASASFIRARLPDRTPHEVAAKPVDQHQKAGTMHVKKQIVMCMRGSKSTGINERSKYIMVATCTATGFSWIHILVKGRNCIFASFGCMPALPICQEGISATFMQSFGPAQSFSIQRRITPFSVTSLYNHPLLSTSCSDSAALDKKRQRDILGFYIGLTQKRCIFLPSSAPSQIALVGSDNNTVRWDQRSLHDVRISLFLRKYIYNEK